MLEQFEKTKEIPPEGFINTKGLPIGSCRFAFDQNMTVVSFILKKKNKCHASFNNA